MLFVIIREQSFKLKMNITVTIPSTVTCACTLRPCMCTSCPNCYLPATVTEGYLATGYHGASVPSHRMALPVLK